MPTQYQPVVVTPSNGGDLITRASSENVGAANYVLKRDWRRVTDGEKRREGDVEFAPNPEVGMDAQSWVGVNEPITLIHYAKKPNGKTAVILGTQTSLFRYFSFEDGNVYVSAPPSEQVFNAGVYENLSGQWLRISSNNSTSGHRWEAKDVAGFTVFNNGVDLPEIYDLNWLSTRPLYELREQGIAFAATIEELNGALFLGDIAEIREDHLDLVMNGRDTNELIVQLSQTGTTINASSSYFTTDDVGSTVTWNNVPFTAKIASFVSSTQVIADVSQTVSSGDAKIAIQYETITNPDYYNRIQYRVLWSNFGDATDFASATPVLASAGSRIVTLSRPMFSLSLGDSIVISGAGASGGDFVSTIISIDYPSRTVIELADPVITGVTQDTSTLGKESTISSLAGNADLQDDNSPILRMQELQSRIVILKETTIFIGRLTGDSAKPLEFIKTYSGPKSVYCRWSLVKINGLNLLYLGKNSFFTFNLSSESPQEHQKLELVKNLVLANVTTSDIAEQVFAFDNSLTQEVYFRIPGSGIDKLLCYDYLQNTCSTSTEDISAGATVGKPYDGIHFGVTDTWVVYGTALGFLLKYDATVFTRITGTLPDGVPTFTVGNYDSNINGGLVSFGDEYDEKDLRSYVLYFGQPDPAPIEVSLYGTRNAHETSTLLFTRIIPNPGSKNLINTFYRRIYFQDRLRITGSALDAKIVRRLFEPTVVVSKSVNRTP